MQYRIGRLSEEIKKEVSQMIFEEIKDPRISSMTSITDIEVSKDLRYAKIYISVYGNDDEKKNTIEGLKSATGFIRHELGKRIKLRYTPELIFELDNSIEYGAHISKILRDLDSQESEDK
ncbi:30S ribosome-binding factor RbfA [Thermoanaerobacterium saccharolyticum]|uniref:Ribosome-binding factor A n=2 Tax=Thermoanaerobacterium TaxID=28895 RepID=W9EFP3_9THEO|nr:MULTISPECIES: 30S ribosome-binding factor RbfA [Thermoanaerobacterium]MDE4541796.1 30S ribosome-binding factor RbfA [Thermoanaerobacterium sp. R66]HHV73635.1 30S ribosome-binding factor RbfA [Thermoanaerobacterium sp.]AFK86833.1 Ribosome-binding factor A [Thermoanaerobacterium saccharolyticum JW/SL-YS485]ETO38549.1 Ribosome-binding factor A [Thermoanaerobacterium aotearoense SCUT27]ORX24203.1 ribosome-binding factor A [Thermoanaerobacterium sp. PSU-2]